VLSDRDLTKDYLLTIHGVLLVYSVGSRESFEDALALYHYMCVVLGGEMAEKLPMILVGNKPNPSHTSEISNEGQSHQYCEFTSYIFPTEGEGLALGIGCDFIETNAQSETGYQVMLMRVAQAIRKRRPTENAPDGDSDMTRPVGNFIFEHDPSSLPSH
jgi:GTPase SAR1 family protein